MEEKRENNQLGSTISIVMLLITIIVLIYFTVNMLTKTENKVITIISVIGLFYAAIWIQTTINGLGNLIGGLMSGYKFCSYRIGNLIWQKEGEKIRFRKFSLTVSGGQCIMTPPDIKDGKLPHVLYNIGGVIMNLIISLIGIMICLIFSDNSIVVLILGVSSIIGIYFALVNGIPLKLGMVNNGGMNALHLGKDEEALYLFWYQLKVSEWQSNGIRLKDMPKEWFNISSGKALSNGVIATIAVNRANRILDEMKFEEAKEAIDELLKLGSQIVGSNICLLACNRIYLELISDNNKDVVEKLYTEETQKIMRIMKNMPLIMRTEYAYTKLFEKNNKKAAEILDRFNKYTKNYPYKGDIETERELMALVDKIEIMI